MSARSTEDGLRAVAMPPRQPAATYPRSPPPLPAETHAAAVGDSSGSQGRWQSKERRRPAVVAMATADGDARALFGMAGCRQVRPRSGRRGQPVPQRAACPALPLARRLPPLPPPPAPPPCGCWPPLMPAVAAPARQW
ncbi:hypothetical protein I4F81_005734 [Pyropia yezoensis]|uniref:Uncharacterized protein n=1 Tax=Pyropia yezoensis TaxID=2788 RepID=A0ACC3C038_PYRYE|nr:hypothetical protein I4F81_005734 [Neopyropia yezoensis]